MISESSIKQKLSALLRDEISLAAFEDWLLPAAWNMFSDSSKAAINLASSIHLLLDEHDDRVLSDAELRRSLLALLNNVVDVPVKFVDELEVRAQAVNKSAPNPIQRTVRFQPSPVTSWVAGWSARPSELALAHVSV